jgi:hypothetical protein
MRAPRPDGEVLELVWGQQLDVRPVTATAARQLEDADTGEMTDEALAGYIAKYATKGTGAHEGVDRPIRDIAHVNHLHLPEHHRRMITTAWDLGSRDEYAGLHLRRWAHMLGFRGHFLTKSRRYSSTFTAINDWLPIRYGHRDDGERELAAAIAECHRARRRSRITLRSAA